MIVSDLQVICQNSKMKPDVILQKTSYTTYCTDIPQDLIASSIKVIKYILLIGILEITMIRNIINIMYYIVLISI